MTGQLHKKTKGRPGRYAKALAAGVLVYLVTSAALEVALQVTLALRLLEIGTSWPT